MMPMLYLKCKTCQTEFPSGMEFDKKAFETSKITGNYHICPDGHSNQYEKEDYFFKE